MSVVFSELSEHSDDGIAEDSEDPPALSHVHAHCNNSTHVCVSSDSEESEVFISSSEESEGSPNVSNSWLNPALHCIFNEGFFTVKEFRIDTGPGIRYISREFLLNCFWTNDLETPCMMCGEEFDNAQSPHIRTFSIHKGDQSEAENLMLALSQLTIQVHNRHLECAISHDVKFITVSDVWLEEVAEAHLSRRSTDEAVALACFVPIRILNYIISALDHDYDYAELWHDYLSVPQWNYNVQQQLLLYLPAIYKASPLCLFHLDDISNSILETASDSNATSRDVVENIGQFFGARWFRCLWLALEYISCTKACLMIESNNLQLQRVHVVNQNLDPLDSFSPRWIFSERSSEIFSSRRVRRSNMTAGGSCRAFSNISIMRRANSNVRVLGEAYRLVSGLECRTYRDRFICIAGLLGLGDYTENARQIPEQTTAACHWVAMKCLERGDVTSLLLVHTGERYIPYARWLRGHEHMHYLMWTAGEVDARATSLSIVNSGRIETELGCVGVVEELFYISFGV